MIEADEIVHSMDADPKKGLHALVLAFDVEAVACFCSFARTISVPHKTPAAPAPARAWRLSGAASQMIAPALLPAVPAFDEVLVEQIDKAGRGVEVAHAYIAGNLDVVEKYDIHAGQEAYGRVRRLEELEKLAATWIEASGLIAHVEAAATKALQALSKIAAQWLA
jgi:hypothetical protein